MLDFERLNLFETFWYLIETRDLVRIESFKLQRLCFFACTPDKDFLGFGFWSKMDNRLEEVVWESLFGGWKWCFVMSFVSIMATFLSFIFTLNSNIFYKDFIYNFSTDTFIFRITSKVFWNTIKRDLLRGREKWNKSCILRRLKKKKWVLDRLTTKFKVRARQSQLNSGKQQTQGSESGWDIYRVEIVATQWTLKRPPNLNVRKNLAISMVEYKAPRNSRILGIVTDWSFSLKYFKHVRYNKSSRSRLTNRMRLDSGNSSFG